MPPTGRLRKQTPQAFASGKAFGVVCPAITLASICMLILAAGLPMYRQARAAR